MRCHNLHAVSMTPHAPCMRLMTPHAPCMRYQWHHMHGACGVIDTAYIYKFFSLPSLFCIWFLLFKVVQNNFCACGVNDTACTMHEVSINRMHTCMLYQWHRMHRACSINDTAYTVHAVSMIPRALCTRCQWHRMQFEKFEYIRELKFTVYSKRL
jgi:hypothetical protein